MRTTPPSFARILVLPLLAVVALLTDSLPAPGQSGSVQWQSDYAKARKKSIQNSKPLLLNIGTENCYWCKQLEARTFKDATIARLVNDRFIAVKIDATTSAYLANALKIQSYPTLVYANSDGKILGYQEGFIEPGPFKDHLLKVLGAVGTPDWMSREYNDAVKASAANDPAKALTLLRNVVDDGKDRPLQVKARALIKELDAKAAAYLKDIKTLAEKGKVSDVTASVRKLALNYPGTPAVREANSLLLKLQAKVATNKEERQRQAKELLKQTRDDYQNRQFLCCLDRCEILTSRFADLEEGTQASKLADEIKSNPEWTKKACDQLGDRLSVLWLSLADTWRKKGQPQQAIFYLEKVVSTFPGSKYSEQAKAKLAQLKGTPPEKDQTTKP